MPLQYHFPTFTNLIDFERLKFWALIILTSMIYIYIILIENTESLQNILSLEVLCRCLLIQRVFRACLFFAFSMGNSSQLMLFAYNLIISNITLLYSKFSVHHCNTIIVFKPQQVVNKICKPHFSVLQLLWFVWLEPEQGRTRGHCIHHHDKYIIHFSVVSDIVTAYKSQNKNATRERETFLHSDLGLDQGINRTINQTNQNLYGIEPLLL